MIIIAALTLAASPTPMEGWANCTRAYILPRVQVQATDVLVDGALKSCAANERAAKKVWTDQYGAQQGAEIFRGIRYKVRQTLVRKVAEAKKANGAR